MKDKQNIRTMIMPSVKNVTKKLIINWTMCKNCCNMKSDNLMRNGRCKKCYQVNMHSNGYSIPCITKHIQKILTSGPVKIKIIDELIWDSQLSSIFSASC